MFTNRNFQHHNFHHGHHSHRHHHDDNYEHFLDAVIGRNEHIPLLTVSNHRSLADDPSLVSNLLSCPL